MNAPILFLTFSNKKDRHLPNLERERKSISRQLADLRRRHMIRVDAEASANLEDIYNHFTDFPDQIAIFHYGGHAGSDHLQLDGGDGHAEGLAELMGQQTSLQLVFLNGCSTQKQVDLLLAQGVKAVIATSVEIEDESATEFAIRFYQALARRNTIPKAFDLAKAFLKAKHKESKRFVSIGTFTQTDSQEGIPWKLHIHPDYRNEIASWKLPFFRPVSMPKGVQKSISTQFKANRYLVQILGDLAKFNPDIYEKMTELDSSQLSQLFISSLPWPLGGQIRILFIREYRAFGALRLKQLLSTYMVTGQLLYFLLLSDYWDLVNDGEIPLADTVPPIPTSSTEYLEFDWLSHFDRLWQHIQAHKATCFVSEFELFAEEWNRDESTLKAAHIRLETLRKTLDQISNAEMEDTCTKAEMALALVFRSAAFLARYRMLTIRNILIDRPRCQELTYELDMGFLNNSDGNFLSLYQDDEKRRKKSFANSHSIILALDEDQLDESLDISPFIIDRNTFIQPLRGNAQDNTAKLFMLGWVKGGRIYFVSIDQTLYSVVEDPLLQVHTDMTQADFLEGNNAEGTLDSDEELEEELDKEFGDEFLDLTEESPKAFELLNLQYLSFLSTMNVTPSA